MSELEPLETLYESGQGAGLPLPPDLARLYGTLWLAIPPGRPCVLANFVTTLDGVTSLGIPGQSGGGEISGFNEHDRMVMGLLRAVSDAVIVGAGTLRAVPQHLWTADYIYPPLAHSYQALRASLGKPGSPLNVIVSASGRLDLALPVFQSGQAPALIVTTSEGAGRLKARSLPRSVQVASVEGSGGAISARAIIAETRKMIAGDVLLAEGGPHLMGDLFGERCLDELFLTLAPQVAGRDGEAQRPGLVAGRLLAPDLPTWGRLVSVKRASSHLLMRYRFDRKS